MRRRDITISVHFSLFYFAKFMNKNKFYVVFKSKTKIRTWTVQIPFNLLNHSRGENGQLSKKKRALC